MITNNVSLSPDAPAQESWTISAGNYLNKISGEQIEYECRRKLETGCKQLIVNFADTEIVNSIGISILLGIIEIAEKSGARVVFSEVNTETIQLFEMLGLTRHVIIASNQQEAISNLSSQRAQGH